MNRMAIGVVAAAALLGAAGELVAEPSYDSAQLRGQEPRRHVKHGKTYGANGAREVARRLKRASKTDS